MNGYRGEVDKVPDYRKHEMFPYMNCNNGKYFYKNQPVPTLGSHPQIDEAIRNGKSCESIGELQALIQAELSGKNPLRKPLSTELFPIISRNITHSYTCTEAWRYIPTGVLAGIIDSIRTRLLQFIIDLTIAFPDASQIPNIRRQADEKTAATITNIFARNIMSETQGDYYDVDASQGSIVAAGNARISGSSASNQVGSDGVSKALEEMRREAELAHSQPVVEAIELLIRAIESETVPKSELVNAVEVAAEHAGFRDRLKSLGKFVANKVGESSIQKAVDLVMNQ